MIKPSPGLYLCVKYLTLNNTRGPATHASGDIQQHASGFKYPEKPDIRNFLQIFYILA